MKAWLIDLATLTSAGTAPARRFLILTRKDGKSLPALRSSGLKWLIYRSFEIVLVLSETVLVLVIDPVIWSNVALLSLEQGGIGGGRGAPW